MNPEQTEEWRAMRVEQSELRARLELLEQRLARFEFAPGAAPRPVVTAAPPPLPEPPPIPVAAMAPVPRGSMEARIGSEWLVRVGVVVLLAALAFGAALLYENVVPYLGPLSKLGLLYLGAGVLAGLGAWLERSRAGRENPQVRNYARVVLAGGLAAVYYVTYTAHYYPNLRVIDSSLVAGLLLTGWAAFMVWLADRRESQTLATFAILLAFYTSAINEIVGFTLASNLPLAVGAVFLLRRHRWKIFPFASLLATYGSYSYWRFFHAVSGHGGLTVVRHPDSFWVASGFLLVYWLLFTGAVFSTSERTLPAVRRAGFASLNNGAFFLLVTWALQESYPGTFWKWALGFGAVLLALAETCRRLPQRLDAETENAFLLEGVLLVTMAFYGYFDGWQLSLVLAAQSVILLAAAARRENRWLLWASVVTGVLACGLALPDTNVPDPGQFRWLGPAVAAALAFDAWRTDRLRGGLPGSKSLPVAGGIFEGLTVLLCLVWGKKYFPYAASFSLFCVVGSVIFALGVETRRRRLLLWSYVLTGVGLIVFWCGFETPQHRQPIQLLGFACLVAQQQFGRRRWQPGPVPPSFSPGVQGTMISAAVLSAWLTWSVAVIHWHDNGIMLAASWSLYAALVFAAGLALRERVYRWLALVVLVGTLGHVLLLDIWQLDTLGRFLSLLCLGIVLLAIGFFYTRYQSRLRDLF